MKLEEVKKYLTKQKLKIVKGKIEFTNNEVEKFMNSYHWMTVISEGVQFEELRVKYLIEKKFKWEYSLKDDVIKKLKKLTKRKIVEKSLEKEI